MATCRNQIMANIRRNTIVFWATWGWIGFAPLAPGTFGSLAALPLCYLLGSAGFVPGLLTIVAFILFATWIAHGAEKIVGRKDPGQVVVDEVCGMVVALWAVPFTPIFVVGGFALFRLFDIIKPFPIRWFDKRVRGGLGIVLDDVIAGIFTNILLRLVW